MKEFEDIKSALATTETDFLLQCSTGQGSLQGIFVNKVRFVFFIPPGELYTPLEKLFLPFDFEVWIAILVTFLIALGTIQIINRASETVRNFVYGRNINTPTLNVAEIFLCGGQVKVPGRNFARFILMLFIIWSLIIRTCYQSMLFEFLQSDARKPGVKTMKEIYESNLTLIIPLDKCNFEQKRLKEFLGEHGK